jgi:pimeloyl-ACP methyl ester carboxylesterase
MADLFSAVNQDAYYGPPVRILSVGDQEGNTILVLLRGQTTNQMWVAVKAGIDDFTGDPAPSLVRTQIEDYRRGHGLAPGTTVLLAGHSYGGMVAQEVACDHPAPDFTVAAIVTWGAPRVCRQIPGITYQQYMSQYDVVPLLSTYQLTPLVLLAGLLGGLGALASMQALPGLKAAFTGQTLVPDMGQYWRLGDWIHTNSTWNDAHDGYGTSAWLARQTLTYWRAGKRVVLPVIP